MSGEIIWTPSDSQVSSANISAFAKSVGLPIPDSLAAYDNLHQWSIEQPQDFHAKLWEFLSIKGSMGARAMAPSTDIRKVAFYPDAQINYAENCLADPDDRVAVIAHRDDGTRREYSRLELHQLVSQISQALVAEGIEEGDRVAGIVTNDVEALAGYLASAAIGAVWASCSPDFGPNGASDRLNQVEPKIILAVAEYAYAGKSIDVSASINAVAQTQSVKKVVVLGETVPASLPNSAVTLKDWIAPFSPGKIDYNRGTFDRPLVIMFSSGTTGKPKCIVHRAGGLLLQHKKELVLHCDVKPNDRLFYFTTCGWMMWNWQITGLSVGATLVTYDGNPGYPESTRLFDLAQADQVTHFGTSAKFIDAAQKAGVIPSDGRDLSALRAVLSTGSPLLENAFDYVYRDWKADLHLASISGGTDICACFVGGVPTLPVRRGEIQAALLGIYVDAFDDEGQSVSGVPGEFVCRNAHVSMPVCFWGDRDDAKYSSAYFERFDNVWAHGDFIEKRESGGFVIHGRSDTVLNPGGVRIGTAEIYRQVEALPEIMEAVVVGQMIEGDQRVVLFVRLANGVALTDELIAKMKKQIRSGATPRHVPAIISAVNDIPRTRSGKISEIAVRDTIEGRAIKNTTALANADCLAEYEAWTKANPVR